MFGNFNDSFSDRVNHKPVFNKMLQNETVLLGGNVTFEVKVISDLHRSAQWFRQKCLNDTDPLCKRDVFEVMEITQFDMGN